MEFIKQVNEKLDECVYKATHKSGLSVFVMPRRGYSKSYSIISTKYGSIDNCFRLPEQSQETCVPDGIAHFLEHKLFEQPDGSNAFDAFSKYGASSNAFTGFDRTAYLFSATSNVYDCLDILLSFVNDPYFTDENVAKEQGIIGQEINMYKDNPDWRVYFNMLCGIYHKHPVKIDIAGTIESINKITKETLYECYNAFYHPSNMALFITGDIEPERVAECINRHIKQEESRGKIERIFPHEEKSVAQSYIEQHLPVSRPIFCLGFKEDIPSGDALKCQLAYDMLMDILVGKSSELYTRLYAEDLIDQHFQGEFGQGGGYAHTAFASTTKDPFKSQQFIFDGIEELKQRGVSMKDFDRAKRMAYGNNLREFNNLDSFARTYLDFWAKDSDRLMADKVIDGIDIDFINQLLTSGFDAKRSTLSVVSAP